MERASQFRLVDARSTDKPANVLILSGLPWFVREREIRCYLTQVYSAAEPQMVRLYTNPVNGVSRGHCLVEYGPHKSLSSSSSAAAIDSASTGASHSVATSGHGSLGAAVAVCLTEVQRQVEAHPYLLSSSAVNDGSSASVVIHMHRTERAAHLSHPHSQEECNSRLHEHSHGASAQNGWQHSAPCRTRSDAEVVLRCMLCVCALTRWDRNGLLPDLPFDPPPLRRPLMGYGNAGFAVRCGPTLLLPNTVTPEGMRALRSLQKRYRSLSAHHASTSRA